MIIVSLQTPCKEKMPSSNKAPRFQQDCSIHRTVKWEKQDSSYAEETKRHKGEIEEKFLIRKKRDLTREEGDEDEEEKRTLTNIQC